MTLSLWIALTVANFIACIAPGQNAAFVGGTALSAGMRRGGIAVLGILVAEAIWAILALFAVLGLIAISGEVLFWAQLAGGVVLVLLGISTIFTVTSGEKTTDRASETSTRKILGLGLIIGFANPLALVFFMSVFPQFLAGGTIFLSASSVAYFTSAIVISSALGLVPYVGAGFLTKLQKPSQLMHRLSGGFLVFFGFATFAAAV